jgi:DNA-binding transcriptional LysR family regulator
VSHFVAIVDAGSLGRAAAALNITEPALSKSIRSLEHALGVKLFDRGPRGLDLTHFGSALLDHARVILTELRRTHSDISELRGAEFGHVYVGSGPTFASSLLPRAVARLVSQKSKVRVTVIEGYADTLLPMVIRGELDFVVTVLPAVVPDLQLAQEIMTHDIAQIVARASHPLAANAVSTLMELQQAKWMLTRSSDLLRQQIDEMFTRAGLEPPKPMIEAASINFMRNMLLESDLISFLPTRLIRRELASGELRVLALPSQDMQFKRAVGVLYRRWASRSPACNLLLDELRKACVEIPQN